MLAAAALALVSASVVAADHAARANHVQAARAAGITAAPYADVAPGVVRRQATATAIDPAATSPLPLTDYYIPYSALPFQVNPYPYLRGPQSGYNQCNSTTEGPNAKCQTLVVNSIDDFCMWGSPEANGQIGSIEAAAVSYCVKAGHGGRVIPAGSITGLQFMKTSKYIQMTGFIKQTGLGLTADDSGGELDPHGADLLGNPLGGLVYSHGLPSGDNKTMVQVSEWNNFIGGGKFCFKLCDPNQGSTNYCENRYDLVGCEYNMPASYKDGEFTSCEGELQDIVGRYVGPDGVSSTWSQPDPLTAPPPYTVRIPASSNCVTYSSAQLFGGASGSSTVSGAQPTGTGASGSKATGTGATRTTGGSAANASQTDAASGAGRVAGSGAALAAVVLGAFALVF